MIILMILCCSFILGCIVINFYVGVAKIEFNKTVYSNDLYEVTVNAYNYVYKELISGAENCPYRTGDLIQYLNSTLTRFDIQLSFSISLNFDYFLH